jgi:hypothetical protein
MRVLFAITIVLLTFGLVHGQGISIGANLGGSYNTANPDIANVDASTGLGFGGGLAFDIDFMMFGAEVDVMYSMYKYGNTINNVDYTTTMNNLVVPVLFKYKIAMPTVSPYFVLGPSLIYGLSGTYESNGTSTDIESDSLETDFGIQVGAGANLGMIPTIGISPYARFQYNLTADDPDTESNSESAYDILFGVIFSYKIK